MKFLMKFNYNNKIKKKMKNNNKDKEKQKKIPVNCLKCMGTGNINQPTIRKDCDLSICIKCKGTGIVWI